MSFDVLASPPQSAFGQLFNSHTIFIFIIITNDDEMQKLYSHEYNTGLCFFFSFYFYFNDDLD